MNMLQKIDWIRSFQGKFTTLQTHTTTPLFVSLHNGAETQIFRFSVVVDTVIAK